MQNVLMFNSPEAGNAYAIADDERLNNYRTKTEIIDNDGDEVCLTE